jgi:hypothetical protein
MIMRNDMVIDGHLLPEPMKMEIDHFDGSKKMEMYITMI